MHYFSNLGTFGNLGLFGNVMTPPLFDLFPTETWDLFEFLMITPLLGTFPKYWRFLILKAPLTGFKAFLTSKRPINITEQVVMGLLLRINVGQKIHIHSITLTEHRSCDTWITSKGSRVFRR